MDELRRPGQGPDRTGGIRPIAPQRRIAALHIAALAVLAFAQPLFDLIGRHGEFLVASRSGALELLGLVLLLVGVVPGALALVGLAAGRLGDAVRGWTHLGLVAVLLAVIALPVFGRLWSGHAGAAVLAAAVAGGAGALAYHQVASVRLLVSFLSIGILVVPANFLLNSDATQLVFPPAGAESGRSVTADTPVVLLVLDELPLASLLDERLEIDQARYPNFAALASTANWYRNATSVSDGTVHGVPAILTGRYPRDGLLPTASDYPDTLFTLLGGSYTIRAQEPVTHLCPPPLCGEDQRRTLQTRAAFFADTAVVLGHALLPPGLAARLLPSVDQNWRGFGRAIFSASQTGSSRSGFEGADHGAALSVAISPERRALYAVHLMLPHLPWRFLPDGHRYPHGQDTPGLGRDERWMADVAAVEHAYQRHLLQVGYTDRVLGQLISKLREGGIFDEALVVVVADHGASFRAGDSRRHLSEANWADILRVPLLVKLPGQTTAAVHDDPVETIDILPTIADVLGIHIPFAVDGHSLLRAAARPGRARMALGYRRGRFSPPSDSASLRESVERKVELFGTGADTGRLFGREHAALVGRRIDEVPGRGGDITGVLAEPELFADVRPDSGRLPALITGSLSGPGLTAAQRVAVAVNGVIRAVAPFKPYGQGVRFRAMVPAASFRAGRNDVEVLLVEGTSGAPSLQHVRLAGQEYVLTSSRGVDRLNTASGQPVPLRRGEVRGYVDAWSRTDVSGYLSLSGWIADPAHDGLPAILVFADERLVASAGPTAPRPDVARALHDDRALQSGFLIRVPLTEVAGARRIRLFGVTARSTASELGYGRGYPFTGPRPRTRVNAHRHAEEYRLVSDAGLERLETARGDVVPLQPGEIRGYVDIWSEDAAKGELVLAGWTADLTHAGPPSVLVLAGDRVVATALPSIDRPDVAKAFNDREVLRSGYQLRVPMSALEGAGRVRVFGLSVDGVASELNYPPGVTDEEPAALGSR